MCHIIYQSRSIESEKGAYLVDTSGDINTLLAGSQLYLRPPEASNARKARVSVDTSGNIRAHFTSQLYLRPPTDHNQIRIPKLHNTNATRKSQLQSPTSESPSTARNKRESNNQDPEWPVTTQILSSSSEDIERTAVSSRSTISPSKLLGQNRDRCSRQVSQPRHLDFFLAPNRGQIQQPKTQGLRAPGA